MKHLPEGMVPHEACGFDRRPYTPLVGETIAIRVRTEASEPPVLCWEADGAAQPERQAVREGERQYRFDLEAFSRTCRVTYRFRAGAERSRTYAFDVARIGEVSPAGPALRTERGYSVQLTGGLLLEVETSPLVLRVRRGQAAGAATRSASFDLEDDFLLDLDALSFTHLLKRSSLPIFTLRFPWEARLNAAGEVLALTQRFDLAARCVFGLGEKFDAVNQRGRRPEARVVERFTQQGEQTYLPVPFFFTETGVGFLRRTARSVEMDFTEGFSIAQRTEGLDVLCEDRLFLGSPAQILKDLQQETGPAALPPEWAFGVWISANGWNCDAEVDAQLAAMKRLHYPASVMVLEAWSDEQTFYRWNDSKHWKSPAALIRRIRDAGLHPVLWQIPVIKADEAAGEALRADEAEAVAQGYCVRNADGTPYRIPENWFKDSLLLDFTNPRARAWWFEKRRYLLERGVEGFKTDGGEMVYDRTARLYDGTGGDEARNLYPLRYVGAYQEFLRENGVQGVTFSRAGYTGAQRMPIHWAGDQLSRFDELRAQLTAGLSAGLSGIPFWSFDIGGFAGELPDAELYLRATAMAAYCPVMQWHAEPRSGQFYATHEDGFNNDRSPWNLAAYWQDARIEQIAAEFARRREALRPYLYEEAQHCAKSGRPMMAHLCYDFPEDAATWEIDDEYMLGRSLLVAPVLVPGAKGRSVYLPKGRWRALFDGGLYEGKTEIDVPCSLEQAIVFERG